MDDGSLPAEVVRLIKDNLESMDHVEVLFRIARQGEVNAEWLAEDAHIERAQVTRVLRDLEKDKLITSHEGQYRVAAGEQAAIEQFAETHNTRPVTLIRAVYARPTPLRSFADAFRIRREE
jgi:transcription initiation factor IIE alpha subunit